MNHRVDCDRLRAINGKSDTFFSARVPLYIDETHARCTLFALMKTLARNEEKRKEEREMRNGRYA